MASPDVYRQVVVVRPTGNGEAFDVWWIDNALARVGRRVLCEEGLVWTVKEVHGARPRETVEAWNGAQRRFEEVLK